MALSDRPDFQAWLTRFEARHEDLDRGSTRSIEDGCDSCDGPLAEPASSTGMCVVCLAEWYGRYQAEAAARIAASLQAALATDEGTPIDVIRDAVNQTLDDYEHETMRRTGELVTT